MIEIIIIEAGRQVEKLSSFYTSGINGESTSIILVCSKLVLNDTKQK